MEEYGENALYSLELFDMTSFLQTDIQCIREIMKHPNALPSDLKGLFAEKDNWLSFWV